MVERRGGRKMKTKTLSVSFFSFIGENRSEAQKSRGLLNCLIDDNSIGFPIN